MKQKINIEGKIPPQAVELETAVIGALIIEAANGLIAFELLEPEYFYNENHQTIFKAAKALYTSGNEIDIMTLVEQLKKSGELEQVGGAYYLSQISEKVGSSANIEYHCRILLQKYTQRRIIEISNKLQIDAYSDDTDSLQLAENAMNEIESINQIFTKGRSKTLKQIQDAHYQEVKKRCELRDKGELSGIHCATDELTYLTGGWQKSDLIIVAGRPSMGKTAFAIQNIVNACRSGKKCYFFSIEMSDVRILDRIYMSITDLTYEEIVRGEMSKLSWEKYYKGIAEVEYWIKNELLIIDETPGITPSYVRSKLKKYPSEIVIIDYLQYMDISIEGKSKTTNDEIQACTRKLKGIAKEFNLPLILLSQLSREVEKRAGRRPQLSDLRDSGAIEQDADMVIFLYRPIYYGFKTDEAGNSNEGLIEFIGAKHRNGACFNSKALHNKTLTKIFDRENKLEF